MEEIKMKNYVEKIKESLKTIMTVFIEYFKSVGIIGKIGLIITLFIVKFVLPDAIFMPLFYQWIKKQLEKKKGEA